MAHVVLVHGIGQQFEGSRLLCATWERAVHDGLERAGRSCPETVEVDCAFYGDLFRPVGKTDDRHLPPYAAGDVEQGFERELLMTWWRNAAALEHSVPGPEAETKVATPLTVQRALNALSHSRFFAGVTMRVLIFSLKQVRRYFEEPELRVAARRRVAHRISQQTRVLVGHSLGSIVAYEATFVNPELAVDTLVTLGSPLGIPNLIFDRLEPAPIDGVGCWPDGVSRWVNIADRGDVVALVKKLSSRFGDHVQDHEVHNGARAHDASRYLSAVETGRGINIALDQ